jgi:hypothetical protein
MFSPKREEIRALLYTTEAASPEATEAATAPPAA